MVDLGRALDINISLVSNNNEFLFKLAVSEI
jgi:hypothetical protein